MNILSGEETIEFLENTIYADTQTAEKGFDLTVKNIYSIETGGEIDFGGGERNDAKIQRIEPELRNPDDDYGWWDLDSGTYLLEHNENLIEEKISILQPLQRLTRNSTTHPTKIIKKLELIPLTVGENSIKIKENSRVSRLLILE